MAKRDEMRVIIREERYGLGVKYTLLGVCRYDRVDHVINRDFNRCSYRLERLDDYTVYYDDYGVVNGVYDEEEDEWDFSYSVFSLTKNKNIVNRFEYCQDLYERICDYKSRKYWSRD